jgi:hypothetical protein
VPPLGAYAVVAAVAAVGTYVAMFPIRRTWPSGSDSSTSPTSADPHPGDAQRGRGGHVRRLPGGDDRGVAASPAPGIFQGSSEPLGVVLARWRHLRRGPDRRHQGRLGPGQDGRRGARRHGPRLPGRDHVPVQDPFGGVPGPVTGKRWTPLLTALWVIVITNAVNLIDGLDGLATGIVAIASGALAIYGLRLVDQGQLPRRQPRTPDRGHRLRGVRRLPPHNFHPARAFMGDAGPLFLGLLMAAATMVIGGRTARHQRPDLLLLRPAVHPGVHPGGPHRRHGVRLRATNRQGHRVPHPGQGPRPSPSLRLGHGPRRTVAILWAWTAVLSAFLLYPLFDKKGNAVIPFGVIVLGLALYTVPPGLPGPSRRNAPSGPPRIARRGAGKRRKRRKRGESRQRDQVGRRRCTPPGHSGHPRCFPGQGPPLGPKISLQSANSGWFRPVLPRSGGGCEDCGVRFPLPVGSDERTRAMVAVGASAGHTE